MGRECGTNEDIEDCNHWLLRCPRWESERQHLLTSMEERLPIFALLTDDIQSATITDLACGDHEIAWLIYSVWTARFGLTVFVDIIYDVMCIPDSASLGLLPSAVTCTCVL